MPDYVQSSTYNYCNKICIDDDSINVVGLCPDTKGRRLTCFTDSGAWTEFYLPEIIDIPTQKPDIEGLVEVNSTVEIISQRVIKTPLVNGYTNADGTVVSGQSISNSECTNLTGRKLIIEGLLKQKVIYTASTEEGDQPLHSAHFSMPFSTFIIIEKDTQLSQRFKITSYIEDVFACKLCERSIFKNTTIFMRASRVC